MSEKSILNYHYKCLIDISSIESQNVGANHTELFDVKEFIRIHDQNASPPGAHEDFNYFEICHFTPCSNSTMEDFSLNCLRKSMEKKYLSSPTSRYIPKIFDTENNSVARNNENKDPNQRQDITPVAPKLSTKSSEILNHLLGKLALTSTDKPISMNAKLRVKNSIKKLISRRRDIFQTPSKTCLRLFDGSPVRKDVKVKANLCEVFPIIQNTETIPYSFIDDCVNKSIYSKKKKVIKMFILLAIFVVISFFLSFHLAETNRIYTLETLTLDELNLYDQFNKNIISNNYFKQLLKKIILEEYQSKYRFQPNLGHHSSFILAVHYQKMDLTKLPVDPSRGIDFECSNQE